MDIQDKMTVTESERNCSILTTAKKEFKIYTLRASESGWQYDDDNVSFSGEDPRHHDCHRRSHHPHRYQTP